MRRFLPLAAFVLVAGISVAANTRYLGLQETGNETMDRNLQKIDAAIGARPTTTTTSSSTSTSTSSSTSTSTSTSTTTSTA